MNHVDFNAGIGGASLAAEWAGFDTVAFCEIDPFCQVVLRKHWPEVPIFDDIRTVTSADVRGAGIGHIDVAHFSPPCQSLSVAGKQQGEADVRYLWPDTVRVIAELRPSWVVIENVDNAVNLVLDLWLDDLDGIGYEAMAVVLPAAAVGAPHLRNRLFVVAHAQQSASNQRPEPTMQRGRAEPAQLVGLGGGGSESLAHTERHESERRGGPGELGSAPSEDEEAAREWEWIRNTPGHSRTAMANTNSRGRQGCVQRDGLKETGIAAPRRDDADGCDATVGDPSNVGRARSGSARHGRAGFESSNPAMEHADGERCTTSIAAAVPGSEGLAAWGRDEDGQLGEPQSGLDRVADEISGGLVGYSSHGLTWPGWPAGMGPCQYDYEPSRTGGNPRKRRLRLKALGNAIVPQQLYPLMVAIAQEIAS